jgi:hypothetical protein
LLQCQHRVSVSVRPRGCLQFRIVDFFIGSAYGPSHTPGDINSSFYRYVFLCKARKGTSFAGGSISSGEWFHQVYTFGQFKTFKYSKGTWRVCQLNSQEISANYPRLLLTKPQIERTRSVLFLRQSFSDMLPPNRVSNGIRERDLSAKQARPPPYPAREVPRCLCILLISFRFVPRFSKPSVLFV